eukprot:GILK01001092.1.p1 GENE.GILK01001092.1~~GILK01001092.1.p1  ORF type:complete len:1074 (+),score=191.88 GILK01001092.1:330-3224(+)
MAAAYDPRAVESAWGSWWENKKYFHADAAKAKDAPADRKFVMVIPPPNVTGSLHLGHTLTCAVEDCLTRWHRMKGDATCWLPGVDHAGIATQSVVERKLYKEQNITRHQLGREAFLDQVWKWKNEYGNRITGQLRRIGASVDWDREAFTMDPKLSHAVNEAFVRMYEQGLIYRDTRLVNWCCQLKTCLSDLEVDYEDLPKATMLRVKSHDNKEYEFGVLIKFAYKVEHSDEEIVVATTRIETMLGDTAVAVHPSDERYKHLHGKFLTHPFLDRKIPIVCDDVLVDPTFGTGAVKVTPAHDHNDFACGRRHKLPEITIFDDDGLMNEQCGQFKGMRRFDCRIEIQKALEEKGLLRGKEDNVMRLGVCSRSGDIIEPMLKPQWWVKCGDMAAAAVKAVRNKELQIIPDFHEGTWYHWLENIKDWCISRQLWWGHRIPAYEVSINGQPAPADPWIVGRTKEDALKQAAAKYNVPESSISLTQDEDVLDTWFSSGLFPFSTFGWPNEQSDDFQAFYPGTLLETGHDILFFWVARMVMMGLTLTGKLPFTKIYLHAMVRDAHGRKMSKSLGNVIDPLEVVEGISLEALQEKLKHGNLDPREVVKAMEGQKKDFPEGIPECGADALRFGLLAYTIQGRNVNLDIQRIVGYRQFCNKLWNATRFALSHMGDSFKPDSTISGVLSIADMWILSRLNHTIKEVTRAFEQYVFGEATQALYSFWLYDLCDVYLELVKPTMGGDQTIPARAAAKRTAQNVLYTCLDRGLRLLHPMMPFLTEELYQRLPNNGNRFESICVAYFPVPVPLWSRPDIEERMKDVQEVIHHLRSLITKSNLPSNSKPKTYVRCRTTTLKDSMTAQLQDIATLAKASEVTIQLFSDPAPEGCSVDIVSDNLEVHLDIKGMVDIGAETAKLNKKKGEVQKLLDSYKKQMSIPNYETKVPANVRENNQKKWDERAKELEAIDNAIANLQKMK